MVAGDRGGNSLVPLLEKPKGDERKGRGTLPFPWTFQMKVKKLKVGTSALLSRAEGGLSL